jgi:hypothetical protein
VFVLVCRGKGGTARAELGEAARFEKMPLSAEVELREEHLELLSLDLAVLSQDATLNQIRCSCHPSPKEEYR